MRRTDANILREITMISPEGEARYGADLLGRAIGHENQAAASGSLAALRGYHPIIAEAIPGATHRTMVLMAAREI